MKNFISILLLIICSKLVGQEKKLVFRNDEFLIGMFNDYNGRVRILSDTKQLSLLTSFFCSQENLAKLFLDTLLTSKKDWTSDIKNENGLIYSKKASEYFKQFYIEKPGIENDSVHFLLLDKSKFETKSQKVGFLAGTFLRYGKLQHGIVTIAMANSDSHFDVTASFVKALDFKIVSESKNSENIPVGQSIQFIPTKEYKVIFEYLTSIKPKEKVCN